MFNDCDNIDYRIISGLMNNKSQESLADELYISINTLKYRIKRCMLNWELADGSSL